MQLTDQSAGFRATPIVGSTVPIGLEQLSLHNVKRKEEL